MTEYKFELKIEPKPGGGFIARSPDPKFPDFEGETREEVETKMRDYIVQMVDQKLDQLHLGPLKAAIHTQFKVTHSTSGATEQSKATFAYNIEPKPEGGFIARCDDPTAPPIEGATQEEVQHQVLLRMKETLGDRLTQLEKLEHLLKTHGADVDVKTHWKVIRDSHGVPGFDSNAAPTASSSTAQSFATSSSGPIQQEPSQPGRMAVKIIIALVAVMLLLLWMRLHR